MILNKAQAKTLKRRLEVVKKSDKTIKRLEKKRDKLIQRLNENQEDIESFKVHIRSLEKWIKRVKEC